MMDLSPTWDWQAAAIILGTLLVGLFWGAVLSFGASNDRIKPR